MWIKKLCLLLMTCSLGFASLQELYVDHELNIREITIDVLESSCVADDLKMQIYGQNRRFFLCNNKNDTKVLVSIVPGSNRHDTFIYFPKPQIDKLKLPKELLKGKCNFISFVDLGEDVAKNMVFLHEFFSYFSSLEDRLGERLRMQSIYGISESEHFVVVLSMLSKSPEMKRYFRKFVVNLGPNFVLSPTHKKLIEDLPKEINMVFCATQSNQRAQFQNYFNSYKNFECINQNASNHLINNVMFNN